MKTIAVDFDSTLHQYDRGWQGGALYGAPIPGAVEALTRLHNEGFRLVVFTCRADNPNQTWAVQDWLTQHGFPEMAVTNVKPQAIAYIDDRGLRFTNWPDMLRYFC